MLIKITFLVGALFCAFLLNAQSIVGNWLGELSVNGMKLPLILHITQVNNSLQATMDSPAQGAKDIKVDQTIFANNELHIELNNIGAAYKGKLVADSITGTFTQNGMNFPLLFKRGIADVKKPNRPQMPKPPFNYNIEELSFVNTAQGNTLAGTLTTPRNVKNFPVVVMITGSGAQDRDETLMDHKPFWVIADHFTKSGIGVLRLDDRGVGGSSKGTDGTTSADFATDIDAAVQYLQKREFKNIGLVGHSEGGMIAPIVASKNKEVKFLISMAGPGIPTAELMVLQNEAILRAGGTQEQEVKAAGDRADSLYQFINNYKGDDFKESLKNYLQKSIGAQPELASLSQIQKEAMITQQLKMFSSEWFRYFIQFNPAAYISKLKIPVLAINGSKDVQVTAEENLNGWKEALRKAGNKKYQLKEFEGLNHLFQEAETGSPVEYAQIEQTISPQVLSVMTNWILNLK